MPSFAELCFSFSACLLFACFPQAQRGEEIAKHQIKEARMTDRMNNVRTVLNSWTSCK